MHSVHSHACLSVSFITLQMDDNEQLMWKVSILHEVLRKMTPHKLQNIEIMADLY